LFQATSRHDRPPASAILLGANSQRNRQEGELTLQSRATDVDIYLNEVPEERRSALVDLRALCIETLPGYEERMEYGMPSYKRPGGEIEVAFASQANYISLYILRKDVLDRFRDQLGTANLGKGCIRFSNPAQVDFEVVRRMLEASVQAEGRIC